MYQPQEDQGNGGAARHGPVHCTCGRTVLPQGCGPAKDQMALSCRSYAHHSSRIVPHPACRQPRVHHIGQPHRLPSHDLITRVRDWGVVEAVLVAQAQGQRGPGFNCAEECVQNQLADEVVQPLMIQEVLGGVFLVGLNLPMLSHESAVHTKSGPFARLPGSLQFGRCCVSQQAFPKQAGLYSATPIEIRGRPGSNRCISSRCEMHRFEPMISTST